MATKYITLPTGQQVNYSFADRNVKSLADKGTYKVSESTDPSPTPSPVTSTTPRLSDRYKTEKETIGTNPALNVSAPDLEELKRKSRAEAQAIVDQITSTFDKYIKTDVENKRKAETSAYISALAGGRASSPTGAAESGAAAIAGEERVRQTISDRDKLISEAYQNADLRASKDYEKKREEFLTSSGNRIEAESKLNEKIKNTAEQELATYAANRSYDEWAKEAGPAKIQQYMKETGMSEPDLKNFFISKKPANTKLFEKTVGDNYVIGYQDPVTKKVITETIPLPKDPGEWQVATIKRDGKEESIFINKTTGATRSINSVQSPTTETVTLTPTDKKSVTEAKIPETDTQTVTYFTNAPKSFQDAFIRAHVTSTTTPTLDYVDAAYRKWVSSGGKSVEVTKTSTSTRQLIK